MAGTYSEIRSKHNHISRAKGPTAAAAREHYARHYGPPSAPLSDHNGDTSPHPPDTPIAWTSPVILGHHQRQNVLDTTVVPIDFHDLLTYSPEADRKNLQDISNF